VAVAKALKPRIKKAAEENQAAQDFGRGVTGGKLPQVEGGKTRDKLAATVGMSEGNRRQVPAYRRTRSITLTAPWWPCRCYHG